MCIWRALSCIFKRVYRVYQMPVLFEHFIHLLRSKHSIHILDNSVYNILLRRTHTLAEDHQHLSNDVSAIVKKVSTICRTRNIPDDKDSLNMTLSFVLGRVDEMLRIRQVYSTLYPELNQFVDSCRQTWYDPTLVWVRTNTLLIPTINLLTMSHLLKIEGMQRDFLILRSSLNSQQEQLDDTLTAVKLLKSLCDLSMIRTLFRTDHERSQELYTMMQTICTDIPAPDEYNRVYGSLCTYVHNFHNDLKMDLSSCLTCCTD